MRRAAVMSAVFSFVTVLVLFTGGIGSIARAPLITYGGLSGALVNYDVAGDLSAPLVRGIDRLPVAWSWSPDGSRLAYVLLDAASGSYEILLWTPELRRTSRVVSNLPYGSPPQWSPDNRTIAAIDMKQDICLYAVATGASTCLNVQPAGQPTWSPDGRSIAYLSRIPEGGLLRVDVADGKLTPLFTGVNGINAPRWSPDGALIAFSYQTDLASLRHLYIIPSHGGAVQALTGGDSWQDQPAWSPDSRYIAYNDHPRGVPAQTEVAIVDVETGAITPVTKHPLNDTDPRWSPDGRYLAFVTDRFFDGRPRLHVVPTDRLDAVEPLELPGIVMRLYAYAWRP